jgi:hypothetical protein
MIGVIKTFSCSWLVLQTLFLVTGQYTLLKIAWETPISAALVKNAQTQNDYTPDTLDWIT